MNVFIKGLAFAFVCAVLLGAPQGALAQAAGKTAAQARISKARVDKGDNNFYGPVYVMIGGRELKLEAQAYEVWIIDGGRQAVYSGRDGSGGYENEGQSLRVFNAQTRKTKKVMSEYLMVDKVTEARTSSGRLVLLVKMSDGGLGGQYLAVVDPLRGEVFIRQWARLLARKGDTLTLGLYREDDWDKFTADEKENAKIKPYKIERYNLNALVKRPVIFNKRDR
jgi:hypothetical protein